MADAHAIDISVERRDRGRETLRALELQLKSCRKERFLMKQKQLKERTQRERYLAELQKELDKEHRQHDQQLSAKNRLSQKLQDVFKALPSNADIDSSLHIIKNSIRQHRPEVQLQALSKCLASKHSAKLPNIDDLENFDPRISNTKQELMSLEAKLVEGAANIHRHRLDLDALQQYGTVRDDAKLQDIEKRIVPDSHHVSVSKAAEICRLQQLFEDLEHQLEEHDAKVAKSAVTATAVAQVAAAQVPPTPASCTIDKISSPIVSHASATTGNIISDTSSVSSPNTAIPKGKGKGKAFVPKCPPPASKAKAAPAVKSVASSPKNNNLLNLHWKVLKNESMSSTTPSNDGGFLAKTAQMAASFSTTSSSVVRVARRQELLLPEAIAAKKVSDDEVCNLPSSSSRHRETIFSSPTDVKMIPTPLLETLFKARTTAVKMPGSCSGSSIDIDENRKPLFERKSLDALGLILMKHLMNHKDDKGFAGVLSIKRGILHCDYHIVEEEKLGLIHRVLREHSQIEKLEAFVKEKGQEALLQLENSLEHRLVHELLKVPQINQRLDCMLFQTQFEHLLRFCAGHLAVIKQALEVLDSKRFILCRFFKIATKFGQGMNRDCRAPQVTRGFTLASFDKMVQTKSTKSPKHNVLHFVLSLMDSDDSNKLFTSKDVESLRKAKSIKSYIVHQDCIELVQGFLGMREISETGNYKKSKGGVVKMEHKRKSMYISTRPTEADDDDERDTRDDDDRFHEEMKDFVDDNSEEIQTLAKDCFNVFKMYKELAIFFDDVRSVYPPPRTDQDSKMDLIDIFYNLAQHVITHRDEMRHDSLRDLVSLSGQESTAVSSSSTRGETNISSVTEGKEVRPPPPS